MFEKAKQLICSFKGENYIHGAGVLAQVGLLAAKEGSSAVVFKDNFPGADAFVDTILNSLKSSDITVSAIEQGPGPNAPRADVIRMAQILTDHQPDVIITFGGGSTIDAAKCAEVLHTLGGSFEDWFGVGQVTAGLNKAGKKLLPHIAIQTAAASGAHLTKYSNITDTATGQKKLIVDEAIIPKYPVFDFEVTYGAPKSLTMDGALDGIAHCVEVLYGLQGKANYEKAYELCEVCLDLIVNYLPKAVKNPKDEEARAALCYGTDLGGYAIMVGGTNGGHLTSFSLVDILSHGRACALMNPYYTMLFAPRVENSLRMMGKIYKKYGYSSADFDALQGRALGEAVANAMFALSKEIDFPITLSEVNGFTDAHIERCLIAAKDPQLDMKLKAMPVPMSAETVDALMGPVLQAAKTGDLSVIPEV